MHCVERSIMYAYHPQCQSAAARAINRLLVGLFIDLGPESKPELNVDELTPLIHLVKMVIED